MHFRKASKRDPTTRVKARQEMAQYLQFSSESGPSDEQVAEARSLVAHLVYLYLRMCFDSDRQVRSALNNLLKHVVRSSLSAVFCIQMSVLLEHARHTGDRKSTRLNSSH